MVIYSSDGKPPGFFMKAALGMAAGVIGSFVGTPAEVKRILLNMILQIHIFFE
jgi:hypothetical protein